MPQKVNMEFELSFWILIFERHLSSYSTLLHFLISSFCRHLEASRRNSHSRDQRVLPLSRHETRQNRCNTASRNRQPSLQWKCHVWQGSVFCRKSYQSRPIHGQGIELEIRLFSYYLLFILSIHFNQMTKWIGPDRELHCPCFCRGSCSDTPTFAIRLRSSPDLRVPRAVALDLRDATIPVTSFPTPSSVSAGTARPDYFSGNSWFTKTTKVIQSFSSSTWGNRDLLNGNFNPKKATSFGNGFAAVTLCFKLLKTFCSNSIW